MYYLKLYNFWQEIAVHFKSLRCLSRVFAYVCSTSTSLKRYKNMVSLQWVHTSQFKIKWKRSYANHTSMACLNNLQRNDAPFKFSKLFCKQEHKTMASAFEKDYRRIDCNNNLFKCWRHLIRVPLTAKWTFMPHWLKSVTWERLSIFKITYYIITNKKVMQVDLAD